MPILWRYLIGHFLQITFSCILAFIAILLTMRLDDIAHFATLGAPFQSMVLFILYQIPYILPIAIPLSCLIAALILFQRLSFTHELTALRATGFSLKNILTPILIVAFTLSLMNFWISSELSTYSHLQTNLLKNELRSINPLLLLNNKHLMRLKGFYFEALGSTQTGESAFKVVLALANKSQQRLNIMLAQQFYALPESFHGKGVTFITSAKSDQDQGFDHLLIENTGESKTDIHDFSDLLQNKVWNVNNDYLQIAFLLTRIKEQKKELKHALKTKDNSYELKHLKYQLNRSFSEITKRLSIGFAPFTFALMGAAFGIMIGRNRHYFNLVSVLTLTTFYLIAFFAAKSTEHHYFLAALLFITPHFMIILASLAHLRRVSKGREYDF